MTLETILKLQRNSYPSSQQWSSTRNHTSDERVHCLTGQKKQAADSEREIARHTHRRLDDGYRVLPWPEDCTVVVFVCMTPCTVCTFDACPSEKVFSVGAGNTRIGEANEWGRVLLQMRADSV
ncbi:hypothetical protein TNCV_3026581 [Trichonephila clavipes]|nr:hypothetical protein TNCV_3026581 [Trichonephila clavipes]